MSEASGPVSLETLVEILKAYVASGHARPSARARAELARASGQSEEAIRNFYAREFEAAGGLGDPWSPPEPGYHPY